MWTEKEIVTIVEDLDTWQGTIGIKVHEIELGKVEDWNINSNQDHKKWT